MNSEISDREKVILTGRIYPAIQSCVGNRYKIIVGYFAIVGFLLFDNDKLKIFINSGGALFVAIIFTIFVIHNSYNYWRNARKQWILEKVEEKIPIVEIFSFLIMVILIWCGFIFLNLQVCTG